MKRVAGCLLLWICNGALQAQEPGLVLPVGHTSSVSSAVYSPDGKYIVTASWDNTAKIWQGSDGRLLYDLKGHTGSLISAVFSKDGKYIVTASKDSTARIWSATNGKMLRELKSHTHWVSDAVFSSNGKYIATASPDHTARIWDVMTGRLIHTLSGHTSDINKAVFSKNDEMILTISKDSRARLWQVSTGRLLYELKGHTDWILSAAFSPDKKYIVTASKDRTVAIWHLQNGHLLRQLQGHRGAVNTIQFSPDGKFIATASNDSTSIIWQISNGKIWSRMKGHSAPVNTAQFSPDGKYVVTSSNDHTARVWLTANGKLLNDLKGHSGPLNTASFNHDGKLIVTASTDNTGRIWNVWDGTLNATLKGHTSVVTSATFSQDGKYMATASWDNTAKIWDASDGKLLSELKGHTDWINAAVFSPDEKYIATASSDNTVKLWTVPGGKLIREFKGHTDWVSSVSFSPDGKLLATTSWDSTARIWSTEGISLHELKGHHDMVKSAAFSNDGTLLITASWDHTAKIWSTENGRLLSDLKGHTDKVRTAAFSMDGKMIITSSWDSTARIWSVKGMLLRELKGHTASVNAAILSPDEKQVVTCAMDNTARIWNLDDGKLLHELKGHTHSVNWASFSPDGKHILTSSWDNTAVIWDASLGTLLHTLKGHTSSLKYASYDASGNFIVTTAEDNTLKKWDARSGKFLYTFFAVDSTDYLAIDQDGHYDGTEAARKMLYYTCGTEIVDLEQFKDLSWEPGLISKLTGLNKEPITAKKLSDINICDYAPLVEEKGYANGVYQYLITPRRGGIGEIELYVNGKLVEKYESASLIRKNNAYWLAVSQQKVSGYFVSGINNQILVKATTREGLMLSRGAVLAASDIKKPVVNPNMYVIAIGISQYKEEKLTLKYASKDAMDFTSAINAAARKLLNTDGRQHVFTYTLNSEPGSTRWPGKSNIEKLIDSIAIKARPDDIVVLFFAGHGILQAGQKNFFLLTAEASAFELAGVEKEVAISTDELKEWLRRIRANKQLLILDACNSGQVVQQLQQLIGKRNIPADQQRALESLKDKTGTFILSASASGQPAYETSLYAQGLLTYSLLAGIKLGTGLKNNKFIDVTRWFNAASDQVRTLAREIGGRQDPQIIGNASFEVGLVDKEVTDNIQLSLKKKIFSRSKFIQDEELLNDDLDISTLVDRELINMSESSKESPMVFVADNTLTESWSIRGRYIVSHDTISLRISLFSGQKDRVLQFESTGTIDKKEEIIRKMAERIRFFLLTEPKS